MGAGKWIIVPQRGSSGFMQQTTERDTDSLASASSEQGESAAVRLPRRAVASDIRLLTQPMCFELARNDDRALPCT